MQRNWLASIYPRLSQDGTMQGISMVVHDITQRRRMQLDLAKSEERLRRLVESTNVIPWEADARTWRFTYVGPQAVKILGYPLTSWYEETFWADHIHEEDRRGALEFCEASSHVSREYEFEYRMISSTGSIVWLHDLVGVETENGAPVTLRGFMIDITERKRGEQALSESTAALRHSHRQIQRLAGRLITAQEEERKRVARELHDDINQKLAALAISLSKMKKAARTGERPARADRRSPNTDVGIDRRRAPPISSPPSRHHGARGLGRRVEVLLRRVQQERRDFNPNEPPR
jgi:PAS domain S-box-containing protein